MFAICSYLRKQSVTKLIDRTSVWVILPPGELLCMVTEQRSILFCWDSLRYSYLWVFSLGSVSFLKRSTIVRQEWGKGDNILHRGWAFPPLGYV